MPFAMCCSPKAAASSWEEAGCVEEKVRRGTWEERDTAGATARSAEEELLGNMATVVSLTEVVLPEKLRSYQSRGNYTTA